MLHIRKINQVFTPFLFLECICKELYQPCKYRHRFPCFHHIFPQFLRCFIEKLILKRSHNVFHFFSDILYRGSEFFRYTFVFVRCKSLPLPVCKQVIHSPHRCLRQQLLNPLAILLECIGIHIRAVRLLALSYPFFQKCHCFFQRFSQTLFRINSSFRSLKCFHRIYFIGFHTLTEPLFRLRIASRKFIQLQNNLLDLLVVPSCCKTFDAIQKRLLTGCITVLQNFFQHILPKQLQFSLIRNPKSRIQIDHMKIVPDDRKTKAVDCRHLCIVDQCRLSLQMDIFRLLLQFFLNRIPNTFFHLCCRSFRECHDEHLIYINRRLIYCQSRDDPLYKHRRLS